MPAGGMQRAGGQSSAVDDAIVLHAPRGGQWPARREGELLERLPYAYRLALEGRDAHARAASLQALELLVAGFRRLRDGTLELGRVRWPDGGKPQVEGGPWFSVSHSGARVAVALSDRCEVGFDVEDLDGPQADRARLERWTATEAALKAVGAGIRRSTGVELARDLATACIDGARLHLRPVDLGAGCVARIAAREPLRRVRVEDCGGG